jgi:transcriptional regulator with XRE-family HTH domain
MKVGDRIKELRTQKQLTQSNLADMVGLTYVQIGRYETYKSTPSSDILQKLAEALDTTTDFLMNGNNNDVVAAQLVDKDLITQYKRIEQLNNEDKYLLKRFINSFLLSAELQSKLAL